MSEIERFPNLTHLDLSSTLIEQISGLENLEYLRIIRLLYLAFEKTIELQTVFDLWID